jgi:hypothetical protein
MKPGWWGLDRSRLTWFAFGIMASQMAWWGLIDAGVDAFASSAALLAIGLPAYTFMVYHMTLDLARLYRQRKRRGVEA